MNLDTWVPGGGNAARFCARCGGRIYQRRFVGYSFGRWLHLRETDYWNNPHQGVL